jgi:alcohol dehydrogenase/S-(hydroxymethyl)glutathione dehydrogenase/alcohol dehydrogenase
LQTPFFSPIIGFPTTLLDEHGLLRRHISRSWSPLSIEHIVIDEPGPTELLIRIAAEGLCRTDYHVTRGERRVAMTPMVLGHEAAGIVERTGVEVVGISPGDHVVLTFIPGCGNCRWCCQGPHHLCALGPRITQGPQLDGTYRRRAGGGLAVGAFCMIGGFAEYTVVDKASVVVIDKAYRLFDTQTTGKAVILPS